MLRSILIYLSKASWAKRIFSRWKISWFVASRFIAGETKEDAIKVIRELNKKGIRTTLDHLGESVTDYEEAHHAASAIIEILEEIKRTGVKSSVSIKPSQIGLVFSKELYLKNLRMIMEKAKKVGNFVRIDMEDSQYTEDTITTFKVIWKESFSDHIGIAIQAYLYRSAKDIFELLEGGSPIRLCKGAYKESAEIAFPKKTDVDRNFDTLTEMLILGVFISGKMALSECGHFPPIAAIASHDEERIEYAKSYAKKLGLPKGAIEFQMLNGIRRDLQEKLIREGYSVRVYVPYGTEWYPYFMRRLAERPANLWFFITNFFRH